VPQIVFELMGELMSQDKGEPVIPPGGVLVTALEHLPGENNPAIADGNG
jgi:hypothetical protein